MGIHTSMSMGVFSLAEAGGRYLYGFLSSLLPLSLYGRYPIRTFDHYESARRQLQTTLLLLLQANHHHYQSSAPSGADTKTPTNPQANSFLSTPVTEKFRRPLAKTYVGIKNPSSLCRWEGAGSRHCLVVSTFIRGFLSIYLPRC